MSRTLCPPSRAHALAHLRQFAPHAAGAYAAGRNTDPGPNQDSAVSKLSPALRYRLITEGETVQTVLAHHPYSAAEKFIQEVFWRTYWKGWLQQRPAVWRRYCRRVRDLQSTWATSATLAEACSGTTGIDGFDAWVEELKATGYLHNHPRLWFASIWIFTLRLPWELGADFFLRHLIDGDPASNTLSWRWVAGLHTKGKTYLATTENIARYTQGRFAPHALATTAVALTEPPYDEEDAGASECLTPFTPSATASETPLLLLVTAEDLNPESLINHPRTVKRAVVVNTATWVFGSPARRYLDAASDDVQRRMTAHFDCEVSTLSHLDVDALTHMAHDHAVSHLITAYPAIGPVAESLREATAALALRGITLSVVHRPWDAVCWPYAHKGFFAFKEKIPSLLSQLIPR